MVSQRSCSFSFSMLFISFILSISSSSTLAQPSPFRKHIIRGPEPYPGRFRDQPSLPSVQQIAKLIREYDTKLHLRDALLNVLEAPSLSEELLDLGRDFAADSLHERRNDNGDLRQKLADLQLALSGLMDVLQAEYGVQMPDVLSSAQPGDFVAAVTTTAAASSTDQMPASTTEAVVTTDPTDNIVLGAGEIPTAVTKIATSTEVEADASATTTTAPSMQPGAGNGWGPHGWGPHGHSWTMAVLEPSSASSTSENTPSPSLPAQPDSSPVAYTFDPNSHSNNAVYYSQTLATFTTPITTICQDPNIDIVILAFLNHLTNPLVGNNASYPTLNLASNCWAASAAQQAAGATSLIDCVGDGFAQQIKQCQGMGKKVMLSLGGAKDYSDTTLTSADQAEEVAGMIWHLFLGGGLDDSGNMGIRPFGDVILDGIDIDNESGSTQYIGDLMSSLHNLYATDPAHKYYLSAAPQCPRPDASIPLSAMRAQADFVWVQFYNNPACNLDSGSGFIESLQAWSSDLQDMESESVAVGNGASSWPKIFAGAPAFADAGSGFVGDGEQFRSIMEQVKALNLPNFGGAMWWGGSYETQSGQLDGNRETFAQIVKDVFD